MQDEIERIDINRILRKIDELDIEKRTKSQEKECEEAANKYAVNGLTKEEVSYEGENITETQVKLERKTNQVETEEIDA